MRYVIVVLASVFVATLAAAGVSAVDPPKAEAATSVRSCTGGKIRLAAPEKKMLQLHARARARHRLPRLCVHPKLQKAADSHSRAMIRSDRFSHGNVGKRLRHFHYRWSTYAENIARDNGGPTASKTFKSWVRSPSHKSNILNRRVREVGIGAVSGEANGRRATAWTVDFGARR